MDRPVIVVGLEKVDRADLARLVANLELVAIQELLALADLVAGLATADNLLFLVQAASQDILAIAVLAGTVAQVGPLVEAENLGILGAVVIAEKAARQDTADSLAIVAIAVFQGSPRWLVAQAQVDIRVRVASLGRAVSAARVESAVTLVHPHGVDRVAVVEPLGIAVHRRGVVAVEHQDLVGLLGQAVPAEFLDKARLAAILDSADRVEARVTAACLA